jgi:hypothetical protein
MMRIPSGFGWGDKNIASRNNDRRLAIFSLLHFLENHLSVKKSFLLDFFNIIVL